MALKLVGMSEFFGKRIHLENLNSNQKDQAVTIVLVDDRAETVLQEQHQRSKTNKGDPENTHKALQPSLLLPASVNRIGPASSSSDLGTQPTTSATISSIGQLQVKPEPAVNYDLDNSTNQTDSSCSKVKVETPPLGSLDFKEDLKKKIMERRKAEGKQMIDLAKEEELRRIQQNQEHLTKEDIERRMKKRLQNNKAAKRCRENRKQQEIQMQKEMSVQVKWRKQLLKAFSELQQEKEVIERLWKESYHNQGVVSAETKKKIDSLLKTDYEKFIPKPERQISVESDQGDSKLDKDKSVDGLGLKSVSVVEDSAKQTNANIEGFKFGTMALFSEMLQEVSNRKEVHSEESMSGCVSAEEDYSERFDRNYTLSQDSSDFIDLTDDTDSGISDDCGIKTSTETCEATANVTAKHTLLELAEATYTEMKESEEICKQMFLSSTEQTSNIKDEDSEFDEEDFVPLVIDLAK